MNALSAAPRVAMACGRSAASQSAGHDCCMSALCQCLSSTLSTQGLLLLYQEGLLHDCS